MTDQTEQFTLYLDAAGQPVQRTVREMTGTEIQLSVVWHHEEVVRTRRAAAAAAEATGRFDRLMGLLAARRWATETGKG